MIDQTALDEMKQAATEAIESSAVNPVRVHPGAILNLVDAVETQTRRAAAMEQEGQVLADLLRHTHGWGIISCVLCEAVANWNKAKATT